MLNLVLPWPPTALSPNTRRDANGWLLPAEPTGLPDAEELRRLYLYDMDTGVFLRRITVGQRAKAGTVPGNTNRGRRRIRFLGKQHFASRLAWLYVYGEWPVGEVDHLNGDKSDDRISNLRDVDHATNLQNLRSARSDNVLSVMGVRSRRQGKFEARIMVSGKSIFIGSFGSEGEAGSAYIEKKRELHAGCTI